MDTNVLTNSDIQNKDLNTKNLFFENQVWDVDQVASYLKCSRGHVYNLVSMNKIPYRKKGGLLRFLSNEIFHWVNES